VQDSQWAALPVRVTTTGCLDDEISLGGVNFKCPWSSLSLEASECPIGPRNSAFRRGFGSSEEET